MTEQPNKLPEEDPSFDEVVSGIRKWVDEPVSATPTDGLALSALLAMHPMEQAGKRRRIGFAGVGWMLAAAALFLFALSQVHVQFRWGDSSLAFGSGQTIIDNSTVLEKLDSIEQRFKLKQAQTEVSVEQLAIRSAQLEAFIQEAAIGLAQGQYAESVTRYNDIQTLLALRHSEGVP